MMLTRLGDFDAVASGSDVVYNLCQFALDADGDGIGPVAANLSGPIPAAPTRGGERALVIMARNYGTADAFLARPQDLDGTETRPKGGIIIPAGSYVEMNPLRWSSWKDGSTHGFVLVLLDGADVEGTVFYSGQGY